MLLLLATEIANYCLVDPVDDLHNADENHLNEQAYLLYILQNVYLVPSTTTSSNRVIFVILPTAPSMSGKVTFMSLTTSRIPWLPTSSVMCALSF
jgi:hypothetical protein